MTDSNPQGSLALVFPETRSKVRIALDSFAKGAGLETESFPDLTSLAVTLGERPRSGVLFSQRDTPPQELDSLYDSLAPPGGGGSKLAPERSSPTEPERPFPS